VLRTRSAAQQQALRARIVLRAAKSATNTQIATEAGVSLAAIEHFIAGYNDRAQPFVWTKTPDQILAKAREQQPTSGTLH